MPSWLDDTRLLWEARFERLGGYLHGLHRRRKPMAAIESHQAEPADRVLVMTRVFDAPRSLVFAAWTRPEHLVRWFGPRGFTLPHFKADIRPGGSYRICMRSPEGKDHWLRGEYREVVAPEWLVFTHAWERPDGTTSPDTEVRVTFSDQEDKTKVTMRQAVFESVAARDGHEGGWSSCLDVLAEYLESLR
jgi:uncharacterized protein YndB with AHSA1/START domain